MPTKVYVEYDMNYFPMLDDVMHKIAGFPAHDTGAGFGSRDMTFPFRGKNKAKAAAEKMSKVHGVKFVSCGGEEVKNDGS